MILSFTGAGATWNLFGKARLITASGVYMSYGAVQGGLQGGVTGAVSGTLAAYNTATTIIDAGMQGYQEGVLRHLDEYARNPEKVTLDETRAGFKGAAWSAGTAAAFAAATHFGMRAWQRRRELIKSREARLQFKCDQAIHKARLDYHQRRYRAAEGKVKNFAQAREALARAGQAGASKEEIKRLRDQVDKAYKDIKTDWFAKMRMKLLAGEANLHTPEGRARHKVVHAYNAADRRFTRQLRNRVAERMQNRGFSEQRYRTFSNSASKGSVGIDVDLGVIEPPRYILGAQGKLVPNPEHLNWRRSLTRTVGGKTVRISPQDLQEAGQEELRAAFQDVFGRKPGEAMLTFTTSYHPEAYRDPGWLGSKRSSTALVYQTDPDWTRQAADVTAFKVNQMAHDNPTLGYYNALQENCRGMVKDIDSKLIPLLEKARNKTAITQMKKVREVMHQFATNQIGPLEAEHQLRILTGNKDGVVEVSQRFGILLTELKKQNR